MAKKRISKDKAIELILKEIDSGSTYSHTFAVIGITWQISERTFDRYWNEAKQIHSENRKEIDEILKEERIDLEREALKASILSRIERLAIASDIGREGNADGDKLRALDYLSKIFGDYSPEKRDYTTKGESFNIASIYGED